MMKLFGKKIPSKPENSEQISAHTTNNSSRTNNQDTQPGSPNSTQITTSNPNNKGFFKRLLGNLNVSKSTAQNEPEQNLSPVSSPNTTLGRSVMASAKKEASQETQRLAKTVLREVHQLAKDEIINQMIEDEEIESEEQAQAAEEEIDNEFYEEYGHILSDAGEEEEDEEEPNEEEYDDQYEFGNQQGGAQNEEYEDEEQEYPYEQEAEQDENISRKQQSEKFYERRIATETDKPRANHFSIEEHAEDDSRRQYQTKSEPNEVYNSKSKRTPKPEPQIKKKKEDIYEVYRNRFFYQTSNEERGINYFYSKDEQINLKGIKYYEVNRNTFASGLTNLIKKVTRYVFILQKNFYVAKKTTGNFAVIECAYPLSRLAKIYIHDKDKVLKFSFYDDEILGFNLTDEKFTLKKCTELVADVQKSLQGINSSIRILQSGQSFE